jgi:uncharacterized protein (DUF433 family)
MTETTPTIASIVKTAGTCGGKARIEGTRLTVARVYDLYVHRDWSPQDIVQQYSHVTLSHVHAALSYAYAHLEEIERDLDEQAEAVRAMEHSQPSLLDRLLSSDLDVATLSNSSAAYLVASGRCSDANRHRLQADLLRRENEMPDGLHLLREALASGSL